MISSLKKSTSSLKPKQGKQRSVLTLISHRSEYFSDYLDADHICVREISGGLLRTRTVAVFPATEKGKAAAERICAENGGAGGRQ